MVLYTYVLRQHITKLPKRITLALASTVYKRRNKMYFDCFYLRKLLIYWIFSIKGCFLSLPPIHFYTFVATRIVLVKVLVGKNQEEKAGFYKNVSKKYIKAIFDVLMDKVIYDKLKKKLSR